MSVESSHGWSEVVSASITPGARDIYRPDGVDHSVYGKRIEAIPPEINTLDGLKNTFPPEVTSDSNRGLNRLKQILRDDSSAYKTFDKKGTPGYEAIRMLFSLSLNAAYGDVVARVQDIQVRNDLKVDGNFGPKTLQAFEASIKAVPKLDTALDLAPLGLGLPQPFITHLETSIRQWRFEPSTLAYRLNQALKTGQGDALKLIVEALAALKPETEFDRKNISKITFEPSTPDQLSIQDRFGQQVTVDIGHTPYWITYINPPNWVRPVHETTVERPTLELKMSNTLGGVSGQVNEVIAPDSFTRDLRHALKNLNPTTASDLVARISTLSSDERAAALQVIRGYISKTTEVPGGDLRIAISSEFPTQIALKNARDEFVAVDFANGQLVVGNDDILSPKFA